MELLGKYKFKLLLEIANISKQAFYYQAKHIRDKDIKDELFFKKIENIFQKNYCKYGSPRITIALNNELKKSSNIKVNHKRVERIMKKFNLKARPIRRKYVSFKGEVGKIAPNLLNYDFATTKPYEKLGTDITVFIGEFGKLYLSPIIDFHTREILAYDLSEHPDYRQIVRMLKNLEKNHKNNYFGAILHSDQGWQYQMEKYRNELNKLNIIQSMSRKGNCLDNSPTENFFGRMKEEMFYGKEKKFKTVEQLKTEIINYIKYYNHERIVVRNRKSPIDFRIEQLNLIN